MQRVGEHLGHPGVEHLEQEDVAKMGRWMIRWPRISGDGWHLLEPAGYQPQLSSMRTVDRRPLADVACQP